MILYVPRFAGQWGRTWRETNELKVTQTRPAQRAPTTASIRRPPNAQNHATEGE